MGLDDDTGLRSQLANYYLWEESERSIRIYLNPTTVDRLQREALIGADGSLSAEAEVGGILIGKTEFDGEQKITLIEDFTPVPCRNQSGPLYRLSEEDTVKFEAALTLCSSDARGLSVVGYYRSHKRDDLYLSSEDINLIQKYFPQPDQVFLLVKTLSSRACTAGFFFWEDGYIQTEFTYLEVPFGPVQSFPIAEPPTPAAARVDDRLAPPAKDLSQTALPIAQPLSLSKPVRRHPARGWLVRALTVTTAAITVTFAGLNFWRSRPSQPQEGAGTSSIASLGLGLHVQRQQGSLQLTWNPTSKELIGAEQAVLYINEGSNERALRLDPGQLRGGAMSFDPNGDDIELRFQVYRGGKLGAAEKVHLLIPNIPVRDPESETALNSTNSQRVPELKKRTVDDRANSSRSDALLPGAPQMEQRRQTVQASSPLAFHTPFRFVAPTRSSSVAALATNLQLEQPPSIPMEIKMSELIATAPVVGPEGPRPPNNPTQSGVERRPLAQKEVPPVPVIPATSGTAVASRSVASFVPPHLIRQVDPAIPLDMRSMITPDLQIDIAVTIDPNGKVTDAKVASANGGAARFISAEVLQAARRFLFRPAQENNRNVESKMVLTFRFSGGRPGK